MNFTKVPTGEALKSGLVALGSTVVTAFLMGYIVYDRDLPRTPPSTVTEARNSLNALTSELGRLHQQPKLPSLGLQWIALNSRVHQSCDLMIEPIVFAAGTPPSEGHYQGNASAWHGRLQAPPIQALACARVMANEFPLVIGSIAQQPESTTILFSLLGSLERPL